MDRVDQLPLDKVMTPRIDCGFRNASDRMVIVRCCGPDQFYLERVVFPFELLSFECPSSAKLEVWTHGIGGPELLEVIQATELAMGQPLTRRDAEVCLADSPWLDAG